MKPNFGDAMLAATRLTRAQKIMEATRMIQSSLMPDGLHPASSAGPAANENPALLLKPTPAAPQDDFACDYQPASSVWPRATPFPGNSPPKNPTLSLHGLRAAPVKRQPLEVVDGAEYLSRSFACAAGERSYKLYVPRREYRGRRPLFVMLHGGTQDADDFAAGTRMNGLAEEHGFLVLYPSQSKNANASLCWNWFRPEDQVRGHGEPSIIAGMTEHVVSQYDIDPRNVFVSGLSAGGAMAVVMAMNYPDLYAGAGIHSGLAYRSATNVASAFSAMRGDPQQRGCQREMPEHRMRCRSIIFHGDADRIVNVSNAARIVAAGKDDTLEHQEIHPPGKRPYSRTIARDGTGAVVREEWLIRGCGHAWSGGSANGSFTDPEGPDASRELTRFFLRSDSVDWERG